MGDFGTMLLIFREDGRNMTQDQFHDWEKEICSVFQDQNVENYLGDSIHPQCVESENEAGARGISAIFTEYWIEEGEIDHIEMQKIIDYDLGQIRSVVEALMKVQGYKYELYQGEW